MQSDDWGFVLLPALDIGLFYITFDAWYLCRVDDINRCQSIAYTIHDAAICLKFLKHRFGNGIFIVAGAEIDVFCGISDVAPAAAIDMSLCSTSQVGIAETQFVAYLGIGKEVGFKSLPTLSAGPADRLVAGPNVGYRVALFRIAGLHIFYQVYLANCVVASTNNESGSLQLGKHSSSYLDSLLASSG